VLRPFVVLLLSLAACRGRDVTVRVTIPDLAGRETPLAGAVVTLLPYDRDSVIASLEARAAQPRPHTGALDSLFAAFRAPFVEFSRLAAVRSRLEQELDAPDAGAPSERARVVRDSLAALEPVLSRSREALERARARYWPAIDSLRQEVRRWRSETYAGYDTLTRQLPGRRLATPVADTTGPDGWATVDITDGRWWVTAESLDPSDPNAEWYWNLPVRSDTVLLNPRTGRHRPRY
jgi:hypothetical protein